MGHFHSASENMDIIVCYGLVICRDLKKLYSGLNVLMMFNVLAGQSSSKIFCFCVVLMISFVKKINSALSISFHEDTKCMILLYK
jgi:hypothetical protein